MTPPIAAEAQCGVLAAVRRPAHPMTLRGVPEGLSGARGANSRPSRPVGGSGVRPSPSGPGRFRRSGAVLTSQQLLVLEGMSFGRSKRQIARDLHVTEDTVRTHSLRLFERLGVSSGPEAVAEGFRLGLLRARPLHPSAVVPVLPERLVEVVPLLALPLTRAEMGARVGLSADGVGDRLKSLYRLLGVSDREHAVRIAVEAGYLTLGAVDGAS